MAAKGKKQRSNSSSSTNAHSFEGKHAKKSTPTHLSIHPNFKFPKQALILPSRVKGIYRLSHREIIDDVADIEHQARMARSSRHGAQAFPVSNTYRKRCAEKGITVEEIMKAARAPDMKPPQKPSELEELTMELMNRRAEARKNEREIAAHQAEQKALEDQLGNLQKEYTKSVRNSESNRVKFQGSVLGLREQLWRETSRTAETSGKLEELRVIKQELGAHHARIDQFLVELDSTSMQIRMLKEIAAKSNGMHTKEYPVLIESFMSRQRTQFDQIKRELKACQQETNYISHELEVVTGKVNHLRYEIEQQNKINNELTTKDQMRTREVKSLQQEVKKLENEIMGLRGKRDLQVRRVEEGVKKNNALRVVVDIAERRVAESEACLRQSIEQLEKVKREIEERQTECTKLWENSIVIKQKRAEAQDKVQSLTKKHDSYLSRSKNTLSKISKRRRQYEEAHETLQKKMKNLDSTLENLDKEAEELRKKIEDANGQVAKQRASLVEQAANNSTVILKLASDQLNE